MKAEMTMEDRKRSGISRAAALGDRCFSYITGEIRAGMTEEEVASRIDRFLLTEGGEELAFPTICVSGHRGCLPHGEPSDKVIENGELLTLDFGSKVDGYCGDMTRTVAVGRISEEQKQIYELVLEAQEAGIAALGVGVRCADVAGAARAILTKAGYGEAFVHGTGHGVGMEVHEAPTLNAKSEETLKAGDFVTVEPGIYLADRMGVRIEDLLIITDAGIINLVQSPKGLLVL